MKRAFNGLLAMAALSGLACGGSYFQETRPTDPDPFLGYVDTSVLDSKFLGTTSRTACGSTPTPCYLAQIGYASGQEVPFYNLGTVAVTALPKDASGANQLLPSIAYGKVYEFGDSCKSVAGFDPARDLYSRERQFPVLSALPLATTAPNTIVVPVVQTFDVGGLSGNTCNDLKTETSIQNGRFGATASQPKGYALRAVIDAAGNLAKLPNRELSAQPGWFRGLQLNHLDGGPIPTDDKGNLVAMEGVIVTYGSTAARPTDNRVIILPKAPGEAGYSPIVRLHEFTAPAGRAVGSYTAICTNLDACAPNEVDVTKVPKVTNVLFIVGSAQ